MTVVTVLPRDHPWTVDDLADLPDDGLRYELVDGTLLVSAAPSKLHQRAVGNLHVLLREACPPDLEVFLAPTDYQPTRTRSLQPDLLVVSRDDPGDGPVTTPLALAVEVLSPSSRSIDRLLKRELYEQAGVAQYWLVDPDEPSVTVWSRTGEQWGAPAVVVGDDRLPLDGPLRLVLHPADLVR
ncbi:MAG: Uma2 family endonuclease [Actinomycetes bacterium]